MINTENSLDIYKEVKQILDPHSNDVRLILCPLVNDDLYKPEDIFMEIANLVLMQRYYYFTQA